MELCFLSPSAGCVQFLQYYYQRGCLYRLRALGERNHLDLTVGEVSCYTFFVLLCTGFGCSDREGEGCVPVHCRAVPCLAACVPRQEGQQDFYPCAWVLWVRKGI